MNYLKNGTRGQTQNTEGIVYPWHADLLKDYPNNCHQMFLHTWMGSDNTSILL